MIGQKDLVPGSQEALIIKLKTAPPLKLGDYDFMFDVSNDVGDVFTEKARDDLRETPENKAEGLKTLRELVKAEPNFNVPHTDDILIKFLRPCKYYPQSAFELMKRFFKFRSTYPQYYVNLYPSCQKDPYSAGILMPLPFRTCDGARVLVIQGGKKWVPKKVGLGDIFKGVILTLDAAIAEPKTQISGVHVILDMEGLSLSHVTYFTPSFARAVLEWVQRCLPCRIRGIHVINQPYIFNMVFAIFKPFIQEKLRKRIYFHGTNRDSLSAFIDRKTLPTYYGGEVDLPHEVGGEAFWKYLCLFDEDFKVQMSYGYTAAKK